MQFDSRRMESIIRYWTLLEELKRHKEEIFGETPQRGVITTIPWKSPDEIPDRLPQLVPVR